MKHVVVAIAACAATSAAADCGTNAGPIFECTVSGGKKQVQVCYGDRVASYVFGRPGQAPELELASSIEDLFYLPWNGVGRSIYEEVAFTNGDFDYTVFAALDRTVLEGDAEEPLTGGISVTSGDELVADLTCDAGSVTGSLDMLYGEKTDAGQCWSYDSFAWSADCPQN